MVGVSFELGSFDFVRKLSLDETTLWWASKLSYEKTSLKWRWNSP